MKNIRLVCFDLDDTLWPCMPTILRAEQTLYQWLQKNRSEITQEYSIESLRDKRRELAIAMPEIQHNLSELRKISLRQLADEFSYDYEWIDKAFEVFYQARQQVEFYTDVEPVLKRLKQKYHLASMTNGNADIRRTALGHLFDYSLSAEMTGAAKPDPAMFEALIRQSNLSVDQVLYVGDHPVQDIKAARDLGIRHVWINRHNSDWNPELPEPDITVQSLYEIGEYLGLGEF